MNTTFAGRLRMLREAAGLTQQQLADRAGISQVQVARWESGVVRDPRLSTLAALARALGTSTVDLIPPLLSRK